MDVHEARTMAIPGDPAASIDQLKREHHEIDRQVTELERRPFLTADEEAEVKRLKRLKLAKKDMIFLLSRNVAPMS